MTFRFSQQNKLVSHDLKGEQSVFPDLDIVTIINYVGIELPSIVMIYKGETLTHQFDCPENARMFLKRNKHTLHGIRVVTFPSRKDIARR